MLVPEIALTPQMVERFKSRLGNAVAVLHSGLSQGEKYDEWRKIERGEAQVVVGARSAIFAPLKTLASLLSMRNMKQAISRRRHQDIMRVI